MHRLTKVKCPTSINMKIENHYNYVRVHSKLIPWKSDTLDNFSTDFKKYKQLIADNLGIDNRHAGILLRNNLHLIDIDEDKIIKNCQICQEQDVDLRGNIRDIKFLELSSDALENRILLLKDMGARYINPAMLRTCAGRVHLISFKAYTKMPSEEIIAENLYSRLHDPPSDVPPLKKFDDYSTVKECRSKCLSHWMKWRLEIPEENDNFLNRLTHKLRYKSFSRLKSSFDILYEDVGLSIETIRKKQCLKNASPDDLQNILTKVPTICGVSVKKLLKENPVLHSMKYKDITMIKLLLEKFGVTSEQLINTPKVLSLNPDALAVGLDTITLEPELEILIDHPHLLQILMTKDGLQRRLDYLHYLNIPAVSVEVLGKSLSAFNRYLRTGTYVRKGKEIALMLEKYLKKDNQHVEMKIKKHPLWSHVDLLTINNTFRYLMNYFNVEDIYKNLQLLLYSKEKVESCISELMKMNELIDEESRYTQCQLLALCAYQIEKEFHFTGDGVWDKNLLSISKSPQELAHETQEWTEYKKKYPLNDVNTFLFIETNKSQKLP